MTISKADMNLIRANQELAAAVGLVGSALAKCAKDRRTSGVRFEVARQALRDAQGDLYEAQGIERPAWLAEPVALFGED